jgi:hypothetical protein
MPTTFYTEAEYNQLRAVASAFHAIERRLGDCEAIKPSQSSCEKHHYSFIPLDSIVFTRAIAEARDIWKAHNQQSNRHYYPRFLDVGCGIGTKVFLSRYVDDIDMCHGLEYDEAYLPLARQLCGNDRIIHADGTEWTGYDAFDIIYMYVPIKDSKLQKALQAQVIKYAKPGTVIVMARCQDDSTTLKRITHHSSWDPSVSIYVKQAIISNPSTP